MSFTDSGQVQIAIAEDKAKTVSDVTTNQLYVANVTGTDLNSSTNAKTSDDINDSNQFTSLKVITTSANTKLDGNLRFDPVTDLLLKAAFRQSQWIPDSSDASGKTSYLVNGSGIDKPEFLVERRTKFINDDDGGKTYNDLRRWLAQVMTQFSLTVGNSDFVKFSASFTAKGFEFLTADASSNTDAGKITGTTYIPASTIDPFDASNSISGFLVKDSNGVDTNMVLETGTLTISMGSGEDPAVGSRFAANVRQGRYDAKLTATYYFKDQKMLDHAWNSKDLSVEFTLDDGAGAYRVVLPKVRIETLGEQAPQIETTLKTELTFKALATDVTLDGVVYNCTAYVQRIEN